MSDKSLSPRQHQILLLCRIGESYALSEILQLLESVRSAISQPTLRRDMAALCEMGYFEKSGSRKTSRYAVHPSNIMHAPLNAHQYCSVEIDSRAGNSGFNFDLFAGVSKGFFNDDELTLLDASTRKYADSSRGASATATKKELERFVIELSWKSSKIEGNTYTLLDTELLLREGLEAEGHTREEAVMILNHKDAFDFVLLSTEDFAHPRLGHIIELHRLLVKGLDIQDGLRKRLIGITGSLYKPLPVPSQIEEAVAALLSAFARLRDPYSRALLIIAGLSYIQPFEDGNKRTSRLSANAVLLAADCAPLSFRSISEVSYREAVLTFYEKNSIYPLKQLFMEQYLFACENYMRISG